MDCVLENSIQASEGAVRLKHLTAKPNDWTSIPRTPRLEKTDNYKLFSGLCMLT
ncbi:hypothetical protein I79_005079 [Cricetulus griseus]|uniref:Uncharacterized protein n=1 Tax=Cricetulus griseus TaxID=10029 RepID=G3H479_CRIGR|nr:hypothetical protein I79_005079 [Cricetulus griseus]